MRRLASDRYLKIRDLYQFDCVGKRVGWWRSCGWLPPRVLHIYSEGAATDRRLVRWFAGDPVVVEPRSAIVYNVTPIRP